MAVNVIVGSAGNNISDTLSTTVNPTDTTIPVSTIALWPNSTYTIVIDKGIVGYEEYIAISGTSGSSLTVSGRGQQNTTGVTHNAGAAVESLPTSGDWNNLTTAVQNVLLATTGAVDTTKVVTPTGTQTLTNKTNKPRVLSATNYTTDTGTSLNCDNLDQFIVTAQAGDLKLNNPTGTPYDGQKLIVAITGTGARALTYDTQYEASTTALPTTTVTTARLTMGFIYRSDTSKWTILAAV